MSITVTMKPAPGERQVCFVGDQLVFELSLDRPTEAGWSAALRTTIGAGATLDDEVIRAYELSRPLGDSPWHDLRMEEIDGGYRLSVVLAEPGFFRSKVYLTDDAGIQHWPGGDDFGVSVHPSAYRTANLIYCAWPRLFGESKEHARWMDGQNDEASKALVEQGHAVIPPSGTLRDVQSSLDHIIDELGCRIVHLLPVNPTPTTFARFGRYGSPYAATDLTGVDPALVEFDQRTTGVEQFCELTQAVHQKGGRVFIDLVINHTGWGSRLQETHPEWFRREKDGRFASPGAWGTVWEDLVELEHDDPDLGRELADVFVTWCRRGVDGFRCDAGYMVPLPIWRYITARVRREFPETIFLLEGLGGAWEVTEDLLTEGGMQWAYSELFQNYSGDQISWYLDYALQQSRRMGLYLHYSETHDNPRLAEKGKAWSLLRNRLCGLTSVSGGYGFTCGVEWLAAEKIVVHERTGLNWGSGDNIVGELSRLNRLLSEHPCFFDGAQCRRVSEDGATVFALSRVSHDGRDWVLVLVNTDLDKETSVTLEPIEQRPALSDLTVDLLDQDLPRTERSSSGHVTFALEPGAVHCLAVSKTIAGPSGDDYRAQAAIRAWAVELVQLVRPEALSGQVSVDQIASLAAADPFAFLARLREWKHVSGPLTWSVFADSAGLESAFPAVVIWEPVDGRRVVPVPPNHWLVINMDRPCEVCLRVCETGQASHARSVEVGEGRHLVCFDSDLFLCRRADLEVRTFDKEGRVHRGVVRFLASEPRLTYACDRIFARESTLEAPVVLLTNRRGGMARLGVSFGSIKSKYDCLLGANLHDEVPVDRHVMAKRARIWVNAGGFISALQEETLVSFQPGPPARWRFLVPAGRGRWVPVELVADMMDQENTTLLQLRRLSWKDVSLTEVEDVYGRANAAQAERADAEEVDGLRVSATLRVDVEDRSFHWETKRSSGGDHFFSSAIQSNDSGFVFSAAADRKLTVSSDHGTFHHEPEWCEGLPHSVEASRGQNGDGDAYSPGWFQMPLELTRPVHVSVSAETKERAGREMVEWFDRRERMRAALIKKAGVSTSDAFGAQLVAAADAFVVKRNDGMTVIAGYPWFLDWGRDSLICARGLMVCGFKEEVIRLVKVYGRFEESGTLPNSIHGEDLSNRDTSDAPLWYGMVCAELVAKHGNEFLDTLLYDTTVPHGKGPKTVGEVLRNIARGYLAGTPNGIRVDGETNLVWSPSHFTWMDTNHPPGTPREGYPVEIQVMWIHLLRLLAEAKVPADGPSWESLAAKAEESFERFYWVEAEGYYADLIVASAGQGAAQGKIDTALRSNYLLAISSGLVQGSRAQRAVSAGLRHLMVPGGLRSLAPLPVSLPLAVHSASGQLLNDPPFPYWGRYEGDEDTRRKPAYHNGTVWGWPLGIGCEAILKAWNSSPAAVAAVRSYLSASAELLEAGCLGQLPEVMDGDAPHTQRGCDAQAWSVTEVIRVWKMVS